LGLEKVISGGQSGADQGGLEAARRAGIPTGGLAPLGFLTEDGPQPELGSRYGLEESSGGYDERTVANARAADATVVFARNPRSDGTRLTLETLKKLRKPCIVNPRPGELRAFLAEHDVRVLNVAGNRESIAPGLAAEVEHLLFEAFTTKD
jgi:sugar/nucleoside kinase (ribokinase family)